MLQVNHLETTTEGIQCSGCGQQFEVRSTSLIHPHRLLEWKEGIAQQHTCKPRSSGKRNRILVWKSPTGEIELEHFWRHMMRRATA